jgi:hypothetical protein
MSVPSFVASGQATAGLFVVAAIALSIIAAYVVTVLRSPVAGSRVTEFHVPRLFRATLRDESKPK